MEGYTDKAYMEAAVRVADRLDLLEGLEIRPDEGAHKAAIQAILARQMLSQQIPVGTLFDSDEMGKSAKDLLTGKFNWNGRHVFMYKKWKPDQSSVPVEAEDMFEEEFLKGFAGTQPPCVIAETMQYKSGAFHYGFTQDGKDAFLKHLESELTSRDVGRWIEVLEDIRKGMGLTAKPASVVVPE